MNDGTVVIPGNTTIRNTNAYLLCIPPIIVDHVIDTQAIIEAIIFGPTDTISSSYKESAGKCQSSRRRGGTVLINQSSIINHNK
jgi:hypothetical protein